MISTIQYEGATLRRISPRDLQPGMQIYQMTDDGPRYEGTVQALRTATVGYQGSHAVEYEGGKQARHDSAQKSLWRKV